MQMKSWIEPATPVKGLPVKFHPVAISINELTAGRTNCQPN
jgi:hypothetical protein